jgi:hypothetical protein
MNLLSANVIQPNKFYTSCWGEQPSYQDRLNKWQDQSEIYEERLTAVTSVEQCTVDFSRAATKSINIEDEF